MSGEEIGQVCGIKPLGLRIREDLAAVLQESRAEVMVDFTTPLAVMENIKTAVENKVARVIGPPF